MDDPEHQDVEVGLAELPVGAVQAQGPGPRHPEQFDDALSDLGVGQFKEPEEALELLILGVLLRLPGEGAGQFDQIDALDRDERQDKGGDELDACFVPR